ncbi:MAG: hypothetical protein RL076_2591, partial [Chloroflexota bacterium]
EPEHGLSEAVLSQTDVLVWWGHMAHDKVQDDVVARVKKHVVERGMGLVVLHSGHFSKIFKALMGTTCDLKWRESDDIERVCRLRPMCRPTSKSPKKCTASALTSLLPIIW